VNICKIQVAVNVDFVRINILRHVFLTGLWTSRLLELLYLVTLLPACVTIKIQHYLKGNAKIIFELLFLPLKFAELEVLSPV